MGLTGSGTTAFCTQCGTAVTAGARFCAHCGQPQARTCQRCGTPLADADRWCPECGDPQSLTAVESLRLGAQASHWDAVQKRLRAGLKGEFNIVRRLGIGGQAAVYLAEESALRRQVAIKVLAAGSLAGAQALERFRREAQTIATLQHPSIVTIYSVRQFEELQFFVMRFLPGRSLASLIDRVGPLPIDAIRAIAYQVGTALQYAHRRNVVHRDVKPANVLFDEDGNAVVTDFGIAKDLEGSSSTATSVVMGTPSYLSPEQCFQRPVTGASDQYALGVVLFEMLTGQLPFRGSTLEIMQGHTQEPPPRLRDLRAECPSDVEAVVHRMLSKRVADRFPSVRDALEALGAFPLPETSALRDLLIEWTSLSTDARGTPLTPTDPRRTPSSAPTERLRTPSGVPSLGGLHEGPRANLTPVDERPPEAAAIDEAAVGDPDPGAPAIEEPAVPDETTSVTASDGVPSVDDAGSLVTVGDDGTLEELEAVEAEPVAAEPPHGEPQPSTLEATERHEESTTVARDSALEADAIEDGVSVVAADAREAEVTPRLEATAEPEAGAEVGEGDVDDALVEEVESDATSEPERLDTSASSGMEGDDSSQVKVGHAASEPTAADVAPEHAASEVPASDQHDPTPGASSSPATQRAEERPLTTTGVTPRPRVTWQLGGVAAVAVVALVMTMKFRGTGDGASREGATSSATAAGGSADTVAGVPPTSGTPEVSGVAPPASAPADSVPTAVAPGDTALRVTLTQLTSPLFPGDSARAPAVEFRRGGKRVSVTEPVRWESDAPEVVRVDATSGQLLAVGEGTTRVRLRVGGTTASLPIRVDAPSPATLEIQGVATLRAGESASLQAIVRDQRGRVLPNAPVRWEVAEPTVATVDQAGGLRSLSAGVVTVAATSGSVTARHAVQVQERPTAVAPPPVRPVEPPPRTTERQPEDVVDSTRRRRPPAPPLLGEADVSAYAARVGGWIVGKAVDELRGAYRVEGGGDAERRDRLVAFASGTEGVKLLSARLATTPDDAAAGRVRAAVELQWATNFGRKRTVLQLYVMPRYDGRQYVFEGFRLASDPRF